MKYLVCIILFTFVSNYLFESKITGKISSSHDGDPIVGANIFLENTSFGSSSNHQGEFELSDIPAGEYIIKATYVGYKLADSPTITLNADEQFSCNLEMEEEIYRSDDIVVTCTRSKRLIKDSPVATDVIHADEIINL